MDISASMSVHCNRIPFSGVLTLVDTLSDRPPGGARKGERVSVPRVNLPSDVAYKMLPTLLGMGVNVSPDFDAHCQRMKVGVITQARIKGYEFQVDGFIYGKDFPEVIERLNSGDEFGMSYETTDTRVQDETAKTWTITNATFTGASIVLASKAAYKSTRFTLKGGQQN